jgi:hypothetical protein
MPLSIDYRCSGLKVLVFQPGDVQAIPCLKQHLPHLRFCAILALVKREVKLAESLSDSHKRRTVAGLACVVTAQVPLEPHGSASGRAT